MNKTETTIVTGRFANDSKTQLLTRGAAGVFLKQMIFIIVLRE
jgi:hypothetical protein